MSHPNQIPCVALMYHAVEPQGAACWRWAVSRRRFLSHVDYLQDQGWVFARIADLDRCSSASAKTIFLTFDDGYADNWFAFDLLGKRGLAATWFVVAGMIGKTSRWERDRSQHRALLNQQQLREIADAGMEVGSHTISHPDLTLLETQAAAEELSVSKDVLEDTLGRPVTSLAYPYGRFNQDIVEHTKRAGYSFACSCRSGWIMPGSDPWAIRRLAIENIDSRSRLARKLALGSNDGSMWGMAKYYVSRVKARLAGGQ